MKPKYPEPNLFPRFLGLLRSGYGGGDLLAWLRRKCGERIRAMLRNPPPPAGERILGPEHEVTFEYENLLLLCDSLSEDDLSRVEIIDQVVIRLWRCDRSQYAEKQFSELRRQANKSKASRNDAIVKKEWAASTLPERNRISRISRITGKARSTVSDTVRRLKQSGEIE